jgi:hypothetical protein
MHFLHPVTQQDNRIGGVMVSVLAWSEVDGGISNEMMMRSSLF